MALPTSDELKQMPGYELEPIVREGLRILVGRRTSGVSDVQHVWKNALVSETNYWDSVLSRKHARDSEKFFSRLENYAQQPFEYAQFAANDDSGEYKVLDVGAGPLTVVGSHHGTRKVTVEAVDPLAEHYNAVLQRHGIVPPVLTRGGKGEALLEMYPPKSFHLVHSLNALDHSYDPLTCIEQMVDVCKPGGSVILIGGENVALLNVYGGLHQWNFMAVDEDLVIWRPDQKHSVQKRLGDKAKVIAKSPATERYFVEIRVL